MPRAAFLRVVALVALVLGSSALVFQTQTSIAQTACTTASPGGGWQNLAIAPQSGTFSAQLFDAPPSRQQIDAMVGLSNGAQTQDSGFA